MLDDEEQNHRHQQAAERDQDFVAGPLHQRILIDAEWDCTIKPPSVRKFDSQSSGHGLVK
jgi:hypothetical protein